MSKNVHVVPHNGKWAVKTENSENAYRVVDTQAEAIQIGTQLAKNNKSELFIHGRDGQIRDRRSYGNDPFPPKG